MIDVMKQALEALEIMKAGHCPEEKIYINNAITALRQAIQKATLQEMSDIGQEIEQEPVAYLMDGELFTAAEYQAIAEQGDGAQPLYVVSLKQKIEQAHTDHPARHWDRTCPACVEEAEKEEPVAYVNNDGFIVETSLGLKEGTPLYTAPPKREWVGLTDDEVVACWARPDLFAIAHAIEAKLKEKNT